MRQSRGFTLFELVVVMIIIGILAAVALPKFLELQKQARISVIETGYNNTRTATTLLHAKAITNGLHHNASACINLFDGQLCSQTEGEADDNIHITFGYPVASTDNLQNLFDDFSARYTFSEQANRVTIRYEEINNCQFSYAAPSAAGNRPTLTQKTNGC